MDTMLPTTKQAGYNLFFKKALAIFLFIYAIFSGSLWAQDRQIIYNTPGTYTWTPPCGVTNIRVFVWGAGGAGGGANNGNTRGGGGGSGAFVWHYNVPVNYGTSYSIVVGAGGVGVVSANGGNGGNSLFKEATGITFLESGGGFGGKLGGTKGDRGNIITSYTGSWGTPGGDGAAAGSDYSGGGGASGSPISNGSVNATGSAGAIAPLGAYPNTNAGNGGNGLSGFWTIGDGGNGSLPGGGGGGGKRLLFTNYKGGNGGNGQVIIEYNGVPNGYCSKTFTNVEPITNVTFNTINNNSSSVLIPAGFALEEFCISTAVAKGSNYPITVQGNNIGSTHHYRVYFDWNQNGSFESTEYYYIGSITNSTGVDGLIATTNITIPNTPTVLLGKTKMRVVKSYNNYTDPCIQETFGQAEDYVIQVNGPCLQPTGTTANGFAGPITVCAGTTVILRQTGGALSAGQSWEWTKTSCTGGAENVNTNSDAAFSIPTSGAGTTTYFVKAINGDCGSSGPCQSITVNVIAPGTISANPGYSTNFSACRNIANASMASFAVGGGATSVTATGLPTGITGNLTGSAGNYTYTLGGTATAAVGTYNYTLTLNPQTPCAVTSISGTITITDIPTISYSGSPFTFCQNAAITPAVPTVNDGGLTTSYVVIGTSLPPGLTLNASTGVISGTPTAISPAANYTIRATNDCGYTDVVINISVILGNTVFDITPNGSQTHCSTTPGIPISLSGSVLGITYQLYRDGSPEGVSVEGTGGLLPMGTYTTAGTYTIVAITGCATNMNGSFTLNITQAADATISYGAPTFCKSGTNPIPTISGNALSGGSFTSTGSLVFADATTGEINLSATNIGTYTITYNVPGVGGCPDYISPAVNVEIVSGPSTYQLLGGGEFCSGGTGLPISLNGSEVGVSYQLFRDGNPLGTLAGTGGTISFGNQTVAGTYMIQATINGCQKWMDGALDIVVKPSPAPIAITPSSATLCQNTVIPLSVSGVPPGTSPEQVYSLGSGNIHMNIPDNNILGISSLLKVTGVPAGATITRININFNITHSYDGDLIINLKGPNSKVLNIANGIGGSGHNFTNTIVASNAGTNISSASAPFTGTYLPHAALSIQGASTLTGNISNASGFNDLYSGSPSSLNGNWFFTVRDVAGGDVGQLVNWTINIYYTTVSNPVSVTWSPISQVFMDAGGTVPYDNSSQARIYAKPSSIGTVPITATYTSGNGCAVSATTNLTVEQSPIITMTADYCSTPGKVKITATSDLPVTDWQWSDGFGTGIGSGNFVRYIEPNTAGTYYVTAKSTAGNNCPVSASMSVAQELVVNGDFEAGNTGFTSGYTYKSDFYDGTPTSGLWPEATYTVDYNPQSYHSYFWGTDHTTANGSGKMMMVNGYTGPLIWSQTVTVLPNTNYYFSAYAVSLNDVGPFANLQFWINGAAIPPPAETGVLPSKDPNNEPGTWVKFYGQWNSGSNTTAQIEIIDLVSSLGGNDFALDDISFGTLSSFLNLTSAVNTDNQQACVGVPITQITYEIGGDGSSPVVTGLPAGLTTYWNGRDLRISGSPRASGTFSYNIQQQVCADTFLNKGGTLTVLPASDAGNFDAPALSACYNSSGSIAVTGNVGSLTWQTSTDGISWTDKTPNNGNYTGVISALYYRVIAQNTAVCAKDTSVGVKLGIKNLWTGKTNDNWFTATNWSDDLVPTASATPCPDVIIPDMQGTGKPYPIIATSSAPINNLIIHSRVSPGVSLTILNNATLQIAGSITAPAASINANDGTIEMNGSGSQNLAGSRFVGKNIERLIVSGGTLNITSEAAPDTLNILEKLSFGNSNSHLNTGDRITLKSTAARTASVGVLNTGNVIGGRFTIERFIQHYLNWNMLTIPVRENISIQNSWQEGGTVPFTSTGFGTRITGPASPPPTGFDNTSLGYSAKWWDHTLNSGAGNWAPVINTTSESVNRRQGFFLFVRGDRGIAPSAPGNTTTLRGSGTIFDANNLPSYAITAPVNTSVSLANPYASAIGFNKLQAANSGKIEANFWVWDPTLWGNYGVGGYQTITAITGYKPTPGGSSIYSSGGSYPNIQSGQAIFVQTTTTDPTINFAESFKEDGSLQVARGSQSQSMDNIDPDQVIMLSTHLYAADGRIMDGNRVVFDDNYSDEVDDIDAEKYNNSYINFGLLRHNKALAVEAKSSLKATDTLFYKMSGLPTGNFRIGVSVQNIAAPHLQAELIDNYLHSRTPVSLTDSTWINFTTTADAASKAANRFMMVFRSTGVVLPVTFVQVAAQRNADRSIDVQWQVANEVNILRYEVERSADGQQFAGILTREAANYSTYRQTDLSPLAMDNFYRIKAIGLNGEILYSAIVKVAPDKSPALITVSPNPVKDKQLQVRFTKYAPGNYTILLSNALGQEIYRRGITVQGSSFVKTIALQSTLAGGHYRLSVYDAEGNRLHSEALMIE